MTEIRLGWGPSHRPERQGTVPALGYRNPTRTLRRSKRSLWQALTNIATKRTGLNGDR